MFYSYYSSGGIFYGESSFYNSLDSLHSTIFSFYRGIKDDDVNSGDNVCRCVHRMYRYRNTHTTCKER